MEHVTTVVRCLEVMLTDLATRLDKAYLYGITTQSPSWMSKTNGATWLAQLIRVLGFSSGYSSDSRALMPA